VGTEQYAVAGEDVRFVSRAEAVEPLPDAGSLVGSLRHGADVAPVHSVAALFGEADDRQLSDRHVIVTAGERGPLGLLVDRIVRTPQAEAPSLLPLPAAAGPVACAWFRGLLRLGDLSCLVLSPRAIDPRAPIGVAGDGQSASLAPARRRRGPAMVLTFTSASLPRVTSARFALPADRIGGIVQSLPAVPLPGARPPVAALGWWRDFAVPILDANRGAAFPASNGSGRYLIARSGDHGASGYVAFAIDPDARLHRATLADRRQAGGGTNGRSRVALYSAGGETVTLLDVGTLLATPRQVETVEPIPAAV
jgi:chemotaxis signal transduction protein